ncbi:hypothetical protein HY004_00315 [Candidatus Saccharibacteria bacterium]|nr:hypothetical protein [Candidatus Saccharibacteria bacterium]
MYIRDGRLKIKHLLSREDLSWAVPFAIIGLALLVSWSIAPMILLAATLHVNVWLAVTGGIILPVLLAAWTVLCWFPVMDVLHKDPLTNSNMWAVVAYMVVWPVSMAGWTLLAPFTLRFVCSIPSRHR